MNKHSVTIVYRSFFHWKKPILCILSFSFLLLKKKISNIWKRFFILFLNHKTKIMQWNFTLHVSPISKSCTKKEITQIYKYASLLFLLKKKVSPISKPSQKTKTNKKKLCNETTRYSCHLFPNHHKKKKIRNYATKLLVTRARSSTWWYHTWFTGTQSSVRDKSRPKGVGPS